MAGRAQPVGPSQTPADRMLADTERPPSPHTPSTEATHEDKGARPSAYAVQKEPALALRPADVSRQPRWAAAGGAPSRHIASAQPLPGSKQTTRRARVSLQPTISPATQSLSTTLGPGLNSSLVCPVTPSLLTERGALCEAGCDGERGPGRALEAPEEFPALTRPCAPSSVSGADGVAVLSALRAGAPLVVRVRLCSECRGLGLIPAGEPDPTRCKQRPHVPQLRPRAAK